MTPPLDIAAIANARLRYARVVFKARGGQRASSDLLEAYQDLQAVYVLAADLARDLGGVVDLDADASTDRRTP